MKENELGKTPTIDECAEVIKKKYLRENKKEDKLRQFKRMTIEPRETFYDFDSRYLNLYDLLENEDRASISVIDYENALRPRQQIYEKIAMEEYKSLEDAGSQAEKYENILQESNFYNNNSNKKERMYSNNYNRNNYHNSFSNNNGYNYNNSWNRTSGRNSRNSRNTPTNIPPNPIHRNNHNMLNNFNNNGINNPYNINNNYLNNRNNNNYKINNNQIPNNDGMDDLINRMQSLQIKTCYFCNQPGHLIKDYAELAKIKQDPNYINYFNSQKN